MSGHIAVAALSSAASQKTPLMSGSISPLAPTHVPELPPIDGVTLATGAAGIKYPNRTDVVLALLAPGTTTAGVLTRSKCPSAPVDWCREKLKSGKARALVVNSGNANAFTGRTGRAATALTAKLAAEAANCSTSEVLLASTGVIGEPLPATKFADVMGDLARSAQPDIWIDAAKAIMTTDTFPKVATATAKLGSATVVINGIAKGAGMIAPDMATMLSFVFTDAPLSATALQGLLKAGVADTFNAVTVDGDTSTSDTLLAFATGAAAARGAPRIETAGDRRLGEFRAALAAVLGNLSEQIARSIANSPLVKTAIAGEDANWGRVVMAVGKAGEPADRDKLSIWFGGIRVAQRGARDPNYDEAAVSAVMKKPEITLKVALGMGKGRDRILTCDLTKEYVAINGDYRS